MAIWHFLLVFALLSPGNTVIFTVEDSQGNPIEGAHISFCARFAITDARGIATFTDIPDLSNTPYGGCTLSIEKEGYTPVQDAFSVPGDMELTYILYSDILATISGTVYFDTSQTPASFTAVRIYDVLTDTRLLSIITDEYGRFSFEMPVDRVLYVIVSEYDDQKFFLSTEKDQVFIVNTRGIHSALSISVRDPQGRPIQEAQVTLSSGSLQYDGSTDERGTAFLEDVINGMYIMMVEKEGYVTVEQTLALTAPERGGTQWVDIVMELSTGLLELEIRTESPVPARVVISQEEEEIYVAMVTEKEQITLTPGLYMVNVSATGYMPVTRQVLILENQTHVMVTDLEKTQRRVQATSEEFSYTGILLIVCGVGFIGGIIMWWRRRSGYSSS
ncbi:MAG: carboxypeptidase regulatory-like domain-containing protein [Theionarchaea archaeon]|nr:carboxypeptidase regulatory-like domain-containing protein [Theionarchaea archaeon]